MEALTVADMTNDDTTRDEEAYRSELAKEFGRRLKEARERRFPKPRQRDWAIAMGLTDVRQYQRWEHGEQLPSLERLPKIIEVAGIDVSDLFETPGGMTRDGLKSYFDERISEEIDEVKKMLEANFYAIAETLGELRAIIDSRLPNQNGL